jgi:hypothetical protein
MRGRGFRTTEEREWKGGGLVRKRENGREEKMVRREGGIP